MGLTLLHLYLPQTWEWLSEDFSGPSGYRFSQLKQHNCLVSPAVHQKASVHSAQLKSQHKHSRLDKGVTTLKTTSFIVKLGVFLSKSATTGIRSVRDTSSSIFRALFSQRKEKLKAKQRHPKSKELKLTAC